MGLFKRKKKKTFSNNDGRPLLKIDNQQILDLKSQGKSNREIAATLRCSEGTIRNRMKSIKNA